MTQTLKKKTLRRPTHVDSWGSVLRPELEIFLGSWGEGFPFTQDFVSQTELLFKIFMVCHDLIA
jgi:hypothetical protein